MNINYILNLYFRKIKNRLMLNKWKLFTVKKIKYVSKLLFKLK